MKGPQTTKTGFKCGPIAPQLGEDLEVSLEPLSGSTDLVVGFGKEESVDLDRGGNDENVANHRIEDVTVGCGVCGVGYVAEVHGMSLAFQSVRVGVGHGGVTIDMEELVEEELAEVVVA